MIQTGGPTAQLTRLLAPSLVALAATVSSATAQGQTEPSAQAVAAESVKTLRFFQKGTGAELSKVEVKLGDAVVFSDPKGEAKLTVPAGATGNISISRKGFETATIPLTDLKDGDVHEFYLYPAITDQDVIVVRGERRTSISRKTVSIKESAKVAPGGDPAQVVRLLPGVQSSAFNPMVVVRGSGPNDSLYYIDDLEVPFVFHNIGALSLVPPSLLSEVQFDNGGFGPEYGNATGGVIVLRTTTDIPERPVTGFVVNLPLYSGVYHMRPLSEDSYLGVSVRRSYVDAIVKKVIEEQNKKNGDKSSALTVAPSFGDAHVFYLKKNDRGYDKLTLIAAKDSIKAVVPTDFAADESGRSSFELETGFVNLGYERYYRIDRDWVYRTTPQVYRFRQSSNFFGNSVNLDITRFRMPTELTRRLSKDEDLNFGIDPAYTVAKADVYSIRPNFDDPTFDPEDAPKTKYVDTVPFSTVATWLNVDQMLGDFKLSPGVRVMYNSQIDRTKADSRLRAIYRVSPELEFKLAVGEYSKAPEPQEASEEFGNEKLDFEKSVHYVLGVKKDFSTEWTTEVQLFQKRAYDVVVSDSATNYANNGSFRSHGAELFIRRNLTGRFFGWLAYTYSKTEARRNDQDPYRPGQYDQTHVVNLAANYELTAAWDLGGRFAHHTGDTTTPIKRAVYNLNLDKYQPREDDNDLYADRLPDYNSLTVYLSKDFLFDTWTMTMKFGLESYWPEPQVFGVSYNYDYSKKQYQEGVSSIPFFEVKGEF